MKKYRNLRMQPSEIVNEINDFYIREIATLKGKRTAAIAAVKAAWKTELQSVTNSTYQITSTSHTFS